MNHCKLPIFFVTLSFALGFFVNSAKGQQTKSIILAGHNAIPKVQTSATGSIDVTLKGDSLMIVGSFKNLTNYYYGSAIFYGEKDEQGNKVINLNPDIAESKTEGTFEQSTNAFKLTDGQLDALNQGNLYINIMSFDHRRGELRAQLPSFN